MLFKWAIRRLLPACLLLFCGAAAAKTQIGVWAYEDANLYVGASLTEEGSCQVIFVSKGDDGLGTNCRYSVNGKEVKISEFIDESGKGERVDGSIRFEYEIEMDSLALIGEGGQRTSLVRVPRLKNEKELFGTK